MKVRTMSLSRRTRITLAVITLPVLLAGIALAVFLTFDWNRARPWLNARASDALGRPFAIRGDLTLTWDHRAHDQQSGWQGWLPWPHLAARDVHLGNPETVTSATAKDKQQGIRAASEPDNNDMASVGAVSFSLNPVALLTKNIEIPEIQVGSPLLVLRRTADGKNNWTFDQNDTPSAWRFDVRRLVLTKGSVRLVDAQQSIDATATIDTIAGSERASAGPGYGIKWQLRGKYNGEAVSGEGKSGAVLSLQRQSTPFPLAAAINMGGTSIAVEGTLTRPTDLAALDMRLKVSGPSMARLYALTGLVLPETPPFFTAGHLSGELGLRSSHWTYSNFIGKVGTSDIAGKLDYRTRPTRPLLTGAIRSRQLVFADLGPLVGADSASSKKARGSEQQAQPSGRVLPVEAFRTERWTSIDADVAFTAAQIVRDKQLPISDLETHFVLQDGVLSLTPLNFSIAGGTLRSNIKLDGSGTVNRRAIRASLKASARHLQLKELFPTLDALQASAGQVNGDASLSAVGNSVAALLGSSNGEVKTLINEGTISKLLLEEMGLNVGNIVMTKLFGDKQVQLHCLAADFAVTNGLMNTRSFIVDTDEATLHVGGTVNLANEQLDLTLKPETKGFRIFSLRAPLYVRGSFQDPDVSVNKGVVALRAGGAVALAVLAPFAALLPLVSAGPGGDAGCATLLANARVAPVAPPAGQTLRGNKAEVGGRPKAGK